VREQAFDDITESANRPMVGGGGGGAERQITRGCTEGQEKEVYFGGGAREGGGKIRERGPEKGGSGKILR